MLVRKRGDRYRVGNWQLPQNGAINKLHLKCRSDILMEIVERDQSSVWSSGNVTCWIYRPGMMAKITEMNRVTEGQSDKKDEKSLKIV